MSVGAWERRAVWDWGLAAWAREGRVMLGVPQSGPGNRHLWCTELERVSEAPPKWRKAVSKRKELRKQVWGLTETMADVDMVLVKEWDPYTERHCVQTGGVWPVEASCVVIKGRERWLIDELPAFLILHPHISLLHVYLLTQVCWDTMFDSYVYAKPCIEAASAIASPVQQRSGRSKSLARSEPNESIYVSE